MTTSVLSDRRPSRHALGLRLALAAVIAMALLGLGSAWSAGSAPKAAPAMPVQQKSNSVLLVTESKDECNFGASSIGPVYVDPVTGEMVGDLTPEVTGC